MADDTTPNLDPPPPEATETPPAAMIAARGEPAWSQVWHLPMLITGVVLFVVGLYMVVPDPPVRNVNRDLDAVEQMIEQQGDLAAAEAALASIETQLPQLTPPQQARYYQYRGDLTYEQTNPVGQLPSQTPEGEQNRRLIIGFYRNAEQLDHKLAPLSLSRYARTLVALGQDGEALALLDKMHDEPAEARCRLVRTLIDKHRQLPPTEQNVDTLTFLVDRYRAEAAQEADPGRRRAAMIWAAGLEARMKLDAGDPNGAIRLLVMERLPRLQKPGEPNNDLAPLYIKLGRAYQDIAQFDTARTNYLEAQTRLRDTPNSDLLAEVFVGLGQIELAQAGEMSLDKAREHFGRVVQNYQTSEVYADALIGLSDCEARLDLTAESTEHFARAVDELLRRTPPHDPRRAVLTDVIDSHVARAIDREDYDRTLDLLQTLAPLYGAKLPAAQLLRFAVTHEKIAEQRTRRAAALRHDLEAGKSDVTREALQLANQQAVIHDEKAGDYYLQHAERVTIADDAAHGESLWRAGAAYDRAQLWAKAVDVYAKFILTRANDPLRVRARAQLGKAYLADRQYEPAVEQFLQLVADHPHSPETYDILVPLAQAYIATGDTAAARRGLEQVVTNHPSITPQSPEYQLALIELGKLLFRMGDQNPDFYVAAIERLTEAVERYGDTGQGPELRFLLADAYRKSIARLDESLIDRQAKTDQLQLQAERRRRLEEAQKLYNQVINELEAKPPAALPGMAHLYRRNAYFYQADCAFDRGQYELAISLYDLAARRFEEDPASLIALVQIVNAHCELGQYQEARVANEQARWQLNRIPDAAFDDPDLPLTRRHWEDWLRWTSQLDVFGPKATAD